MPLPLPISFQAFVHPLSLFLLPPPPLCYISYDVVRHVCNLLFLIARVTLTTACLIYVRRQSQSKPRIPFHFRALNSPPAVLPPPQVATPAVLARCAAQGTTQTILNPPANIASPSASPVLMITSRRNADHLICTESPASLTCSSLIPDLRWRWPLLPQVLAPATGSRRCRRRATATRVPKRREHFASFRPTEPDKSKAIGHRAHIQHWPNCLYFPRAVTEQRWVDPVLRLIAGFALPDHRRCVSGTLPADVFVFLQRLFC